MKDYRAVRRDTIAAIVTASGAAGVGIVRISGPKSRSIAAQICRCHDEIPSHRVNLKTFYHSVEGHALPFDQGLLIYMQAPRSFTGEDVVELQGHGGHYVMQALLHACLNAGARMALPGEFSFRAFENGKIDLAQAEAIASLIGAKTRASAVLAQEMLEGGLSRRVEAYQERLSRLAAILEAWVDFPEEGLEFASSDEVIADLRPIIVDLDHLIATYDDGARLTQGVKLAIVGAPNAGKSSLLNTLLKRDRAIVSEYEGTTRDLLSEEMSLGGIPIQLIDTAGIRSCGGEIEQEGIRRSRRALIEADIVLWVVDIETKRFDPALLEAVKDLLQSDLTEDSTAPSSCSLDSSDRISSGQRAPLRRLLIVWNKIDQWLGQESEGSSVKLSQQCENAFSGSKESIEILKRESSSYRWLYDWIERECPDHREHLESQACFVSATKSMGLDGLKERIGALSRHDTGNSPDEVVLTHYRHKEALEEASKALKDVLTGLEREVSAEFISSDMKHALASLAQICGRDVTEDILDSIFSQFCIGK